MTSWSNAFTRLAFAALVLAPANAHAFWGQKWGVASCRSSVAGSCDQIADKTALYRGTTPDLIYYDPDGTYYKLGSTTVTTGRWKVDESGENVILRTFGAGQFAPQPIGQFFSRASDVIEGDPAGLSKNKRGLYLLPLRDLPTNEIIENVRAR